MMWKKILRFGNHFEVILVYITMRHEFAIEVGMVIFHHADAGRTGRGPRTETDDRLSLRLSAVLIAGLSALSWAVLISIVVAIRALV
jgi:hypothetical protein